jgi:hypothetical protein
MSLHRRCAHGVEGIPTSPPASWKARATAGARTETAAPLELDEWERLLARACRRGSVSALRLWRETHGRGIGQATAQVDELARLRELHTRLEAQR